jgi:hypothetical protein
MASRLPDAAIPPAADACNADKNAVTISAILRISDIPFPHYF